MIKAPDNKSEKTNSVGHASTLISTSGGSNLYSDRHCNHCGILSSILLAIFRSKVLLFPVAFLGRVKPLAIA